MRGRAIAGLLTAALAVVAAPGAAAPGVPSALRIVSVSASGADQVGTTVTVTFAGDVEHALGRGQLKKALVVVLLKSKAAKGPLRGVATEGGGALGETQSLRAPGAGVVRDGRRLLFFVPGAGASGIGKVAVKAFAKAPAPKRTRSLAAAGQAFPDSYWSLLAVQLATVEAEADLIDFVATDASCEKLIDLRSELAQLDAKLDRNATLFKELRPKIDQAIAETEAKIESGVRNVGIIALHTILAPLVVFYVAAYGETPAQTFDSWKDLLRSLKLDRKLADALEAKNKALGDRLFKLRQKLDALVEEKCAPKPPLIRIHAEFVQAEFSTHYTVITEQPVTVPISHTWTGFQWELTRPEDDPNCNNRGQTTSEASEFVWYHGSDVCGHNNEVPTVHDGVVGVIVTDSMWRCSASFRGTNTNNGKQQVCSRR